MRISDWSSDVCSSDLRLRYTRDVPDDRLALVILQLYHQLRETFAGFVGLVAADEPFTLQHVEKTRAQVGARRLHRIQSRLLSVADAGQQVAERIAQCHGPLPSLLPARLDHARDLATRGQLAERDARHAELAVIAARTPGHLAAVADARRRRVPRQFGEPELRDRSEEHTSELQS